MGFCSCFNKLILVILNLVVFVIGVAVIALASIVIHRGTHYQDMLLAGNITLPIWTMIVGIVVTLLGFFGCCGAMKENRCMLYTYASIVTVLFVAEITLGILVAIYPEHAKGQVKTALKQTFDKFGGNDTSLNSAINSLQHDMDCCGVESYEDWFNLKYGRIPESCCKDQTDCDSKTEDKIYTQGCFYAILDDLEDVTVALGVTALILAIVQVVCVCIACGLAQKRSEYV